jgi:hypothetical protein
MGLRNPIKSKCFLNKICTESKVNFEYWQKTKPFESWQDVGQFSNAALMGCLLPYCCHFMQNKHKSEPNHQIETQF